jgi:hypothetical protein
MEEKPGRISLGSIIRFGKNLPIGRQINLILPGDRLMMEQSIDETTAETDIRFKKNYPPLLGQDSRCFLKKQSRAFQMMKNVEQDQMT